MTATPAADHPAAKSRRQKTCACGVCGRDTAVNRDGALRVHGLPEDRCPGTGVKVPAAVRPVRQDGAVIVYGTCGVCGIYDGACVVTDVKRFMRDHNHGRPRVTEQGGRFSVFWFRYRTFEWRNRYFDTRAEAMDFATNIKEHSR